MECVLNSSLLRFFSVGSLDRCWLCILLVLYWVIEVKFGLMYFIMLLWLISRKVLVFCFIVCWNRCRVLEILCCLWFIRICVYWLVSFLVKVILLFCYMWFLLVCFRYSMLIILLLMWMVVLSRVLMFSGFR